MAATAALTPALERAVPLLLDEARTKGRVHEDAYLDLLGPSPPSSTGPIQDLMLTSLVPRVYERWWRPAFGRVAKGLLGPSMGEECGSPAVCCFAALHLFADPVRALDRMTAVLTPGGRMALFTSVRGRSAPLRTMESIAASRSGAWLFERTELVGALERRGYVEIRQRIGGVTQFVGGRLAG